jgi:hypothetical protein
VIELLVNPADTVKTEQSLNPKRFGLFFAVCWFE